jgi:glycosyltransferase involved in cell wall biosynthesis
VLRVGFNAYLLADGNRRGWNRYTVNLLAALPAEGVRPVLYTRAPIHPDHLARLPPGSYEVRCAPPMRYVLWENVWLPRQLRRDRIDLFHCPMNFGLPWSTPCPRLLTLHDAIDQVYYLRRVPWRERWSRSALRLRWTLWACRVRAHHILTVSRHAREDLVRVLGVPPEKVSVVYEAADPQFQRRLEAEAVQAVRTQWGLERPYFFYAGGWEDRKNVPFLLEAFAQASLPQVDLVVVGGTPPQQQTLRALAEKLGCAAQVRLLGFVPDSVLHALYAGAWAFVYPSRYEGFGLQLCEAMAVGCPVLAARASALPEILGDGGETFSLDSPQELICLLRQVAADPDYRRQLQQRAHQRSQHFSWQKTAQETVQIYHQLLQRKSI